MSRRISTSQTADYCASQILQVTPALVSLIRSGFDARLSITLAQYRALSLLENNFLNHRELSQNLGVTLPVVSRMFDGLVQRDFVKRAQSEHDRRQVRLTLTTKGVRAVQKAEAQIQLALKGLLSGLAAEEMEDLSRGLAVLASLLPTGAAATENIPVGRFQKSLKTSIRGEAQ